MPVLWQVDVFNPSTQKNYTFPCGDWFSKANGLRKELIAGEEGAGRGVCFPGSQVLCVRK